MKTTDLLILFKHGKAEPTGELWQQLLWNAANLVRLAEIERKTFRASHEQTSTHDPRQMDLFDERRGGD